MQAETMLPQSDKTMEVPAYELGLVGVVAMHCFKCGGSKQFWNVPLRWIGYLEWCCGQVMFGSFPTPHGNASLN